METGGGDERVPEGAINWKAPDRFRLGLVPMVHSRIEISSIEVAPTVSPLPNRSNQRR